MICVHITESVLQSLWFKIWQSCVATCPALGVSMCVYIHTHVHCTSFSHVLYMSTCVYMCVCVYMWVCISCGYNDTFQTPVET